MYAKTITRSLSRSRCLNITEKVSIFGHGNHVMFWHMAIFGQICHGQKLPWPKIAIVLIEFRIHLTVCLAQHFFKHSRNLHIKYLLIVQKIRLFVTSPKTHQITMSYSTNQFTKNMKNRFFISFGVCYVQKLRIKQDWKFQSIRASQYNF